MNSHQRVHTVLWHLWQRTAAVLHLAELRMTSNLRTSSKIDLTGQSVWVKYSVIPACCFCPSFLYWHEFDDRTWIVNLCTVFFRIRKWELRRQTFTHRHILCVPLLYFVSSSVKIIEVIWIKHKNKCMTLKLVQQIKMLFFKLMAWEIVFFVANSCFLTLTGINLLNVD